VKRRFFLSPPRSLGIVRRALGATILTLPILMIMILLIMVAQPAFAGLGEDATSISADQARLHGTLRTTQSDGYTIHEIDSASGSAVREYVSASGRVFAVAWQGPWPPKMRQVLATYFDQYKQAMQVQANQHAGRRPVLIQQPGLVVQAGGHMRSFSGRAYIPAMLPQGMSAEAIR
jgi:Protein of unknown function (DUF2844)